MTATAAVNGTPIGRVIPKGLSMPARIAVSWAVAGGVGLGGVVVGLMTMSGMLSGNGLLVTCMALFLIGSMLGFLHGAVLGVMGRPEGMTMRAAVAALAFGALYTIPALAVSFLVAGWIAMTPIAIYAGKIGAEIGCGVAWLVGAAIIAGAVSVGGRALRNAYARWEERRHGTMIVAASYVALLLTFLADRPVLWGLNMRVTEVGAVLLATSITLWFVGPLVTMVLPLRKQIGIAAAAINPTKRALLNVAIGLAAGVVLGLIAVPFAAARFGVQASAQQAGPLGAVVLAVSAAFVNEILLRLVVVTAVAALLLRWHQNNREEAAVVSVIIATLLQIALYLPGVLAIGFPNALSAIAFILTAVALPAIVFGTLFWKRGLGTAVIADAAALVAIAVLAA